MFYINKITSDSVIDYAAEELKKYLRMMMPEGGDVKIAYNPEAKDGFRLGLMQDFSLDVSDAEDTFLDDILYIDCDERGGIIAGDNPRSVLLSVYEYLRRNGCRWLMPTVDGEYIPMQNIVPVKYRHKPSMRYRGWCNEGSESQKTMLDAIEFAPKVGLNVFMLEFRIPTSYYNRHYLHEHNEKRRPPEPVTDAQILQWKRQTEAEISKRGLQFHDIGHGWTTDAFGIDSSRRYDPKDPTKNMRSLTPDQVECLAMIDGVRELQGDTPNYTQCCMGPEKNRAAIVKYVCDYAEKHSNVDYLHVWLGDAMNKHCECDVCKQKTTSDWYAILLNQIDEELTKRNLPTRIVFCAYSDTMWAPETEMIKNKTRFTLLFGPISRKYTVPIPEEKKDEPIVPAVRNKLEMPKTIDGMLAYHREWKKHYTGGSIAYEYHFWRHMYHDIAGLEMAKLVNKDIKTYPIHGINGIIEDGSQRAFFPNGLGFYTYARTLFDSSLSYDEILEDYFSHIYGKDWRLFLDYLEKINRAFDQEYLEGQKCTDENRTNYYNPEHAKSLETVRDIVAEGMELIKSHYNSDVRVQTVAARVLEVHAKYLPLIADAFIKKALGEDEEAEALFNVAKEKMGEYDAEFESFYDHTLVFYSWRWISRTRRKVTEPVLVIDN